MGRQRRVAVCLRLRRSSVRTRKAKRYSRSRSYLRSAALHSPAARAYRIDRASGLRTCKACRAGQVSETREARVRKRVGAELELGLLGHDVFGGELDRR